MPPSAAGRHRRLQPEGGAAHRRERVARTPGAPGPEIAKRAPDNSRIPRELPAHGGVPVAGAPDASVTRPGDAGANVEKTDPSGAVITQSPDPLLKGMDAEKSNDAAYRAAYRECMRVKVAR